MINQGYETNKSSKNTLDEGLSTNASSRVTFDDAISTVSNVSETCDLLLFLICKYVTFKKFQWYDIIKLWTCCFVFERYQSVFALASKFKMSAYMQCICKLLVFILHQIGPGP